MRTITARELRNEYARILRELEDAGESYTITNHGRPVALISAIAPVPDRLRAYSGVPLSAAASLNATAGPLDHAEADRQVAQMLDPFARDPYAGRADEAEADTERARPRSQGGSTVDARAVQEWAAANGYEIAPRGPRLSELTEQIAHERSSQA